jgi:hypothetical protein
MNYVCYFCGAPGTLICDDKINDVVDCEFCCKRFNLDNAKTYYFLKHNELDVFAISWSLHLNSEKYVTVESYFEGSADLRNRNKSIIYIKNNSNNITDDIVINGHPFNCENVKSKVKIYLLMS